MPWIARYNGEKKAPRQVPKGEEAACLTCGGTVRVRGPFKDGRARHFWHTDNLGGNGGGGGGSCDSVAESDTHMKWKSLAADRLEQVFEGNVESCKMERGMKAPWSDSDRRVADVCVEFQQPDEVLGAGLVVEVQHKNESKDIPATTRDYIEQDFAVAWLSKEDFNADRCPLLEVDFRHRAKEAVWPDELPLRVRRKEVRFDEIERKWQQASDRGLVAADVPAKLPKEFFDDHAKELWDAHEWEELFCPSEVGRYRLQAALSGGTPTVSSDVTFPPEVLDSVAYEESEWDSLFAIKPDSNQPSVTLDVDFAPFFPEAFWWEAFRSWQADDTDIEPPPTAFDDVQCHKCAHYTYWKSAGERCENCGARYDWEWNVRTGRISGDSVPYGVVP